MKQKLKLKQFFLLTVIALTVLSQLGCQAVSEQKSSLSQKTNQQKSTVSSSPTTNLPTPKETKPNSKAQLEITVYFASPQADKLIKEKREIEATETVAKAVLEELIKGPKENKEAQPTIPTGTKLLSVAIVNKVAKVNFSSEFADNHSGGSAAELMTIYSVVNSLTEFPTIEAVEFLIQNQKLTALGGFDLSEPVKRRNDLL